MSPRTALEGASSPKAKDAIFLPSYLLPVVLFFAFLLLFFWGLHLQHIEVPRLGAEPELQLPAYATATATPDPSPTERGQRSNLHPYGY